MPNNQVRWRPTSVGIGSSLTINRPNIDKKFSNRSKTAKAYTPRHQSGK